MSKTVRRVELGDRAVLLVGTAHISPESIEEVRSLIASERPTRVCVEIDEGRWKSMSEGQDWASLDIGKVLREGKGFLLMANLALSGFQRRMGSEVGVKPGEEMLAAVRAAEELGIPEDNWPLLKRTITVSGMGPQVSLDLLTQGQDTVEDAGTQSPDEQLLNADLIAKLGELLDVIDEREATILRLRYGLGTSDGASMTLKEIGKVVGLTRERVRQIEQEALKKLYGVMSDE